MDVFFKLPVTSEGNYDVPASGVGLVTQTSVTVTTIQYLDGTILTLTHATVGANNETMRDDIQVAIVEANKQHWNQVNIHLAVVSVAVSAVVVSNIVVPVA